MTSPDPVELLNQIEKALEQAQDCIKGETPEDVTHEEARIDTIDKVRDAMHAVDALRRHQPNERLTPYAVIALNDARAELQKRDVCEINETALARMSASTRHES